MQISYRHVWVAIALLGLGFILTQSYLAEPRDWLVFAQDSLLPIAVVATIVYLLLTTSHPPMLWLGLLFLVFTGITFVTTIIEKPYGTFFFLFAVYLLVDWYTFAKFGHSIMVELRRDRSVIAVGVMASTFLYGLLTEVVNVPFMIWSYQIPLPSLDMGGVPVLIATFGWTPWTLSILAIFYHFVLRQKQILTG